MLKEQNVMQVNKSGNGKKVILLLLVVLLGLLVINIPEVSAKVPEPPSSIGTDADPLTTTETLGKNVTETASLWVAVVVIFAAAIALGVSLFRAMTDRGSWAEPAIALFIGAIVVIAVLYWLNMASTIFA